MRSTPSLSLAGVVSVLPPRFLSALTLCMILLLLNACMAGQSAGRMSPDAVWTDLCRRGAEKQLYPHLFKAGEFHLCGLLRLPAPGDKATGELVIYIEGDGRIFDKRGRVRSHPTPQFAQSCELALKDPAPGLLYLARIGQFNSRNQGRIFQ
ncbi:MAG: hypothetical protein IJD04_09155, partial [Desulfovibrionaceae bacterium]|nr:hypothetical protein [Desulfovibrionaceae bacterium]